MSSNDNKNDDNDNIVPFEKKMRKKQVRQKEEPRPSSINSNSYDKNKVSEPLINMPPYTKYLLGALILIHLVTTFILNEEQFRWVLINLGFIPGRFSGEVLFEPMALITPFTNMFFHSGWLHLGMNTIMLLAFGSGIEKWLGGKKMIAFFVICGLFGVVLHFILNMHSITPVIGASGGISGLFAAALIMLNQKQGGMTGRYGLWPIIVIWVGVSVLFGFIDSPQMGVAKGEIAWAAHVGGFLGGFITLKAMKLI